MITFSLYLYIIFSLFSLRWKEVEEDWWGWQLIIRYTSVGCESPPRVRTTTLSLSVCYIVPLAMRFCCALIALYRTDDTYISFVCHILFYFFSYIFSLSLYSSFIFSFGIDVVYRGWSGRVKKRRRDKQRLREKEKGNNIKASLGLLQGGHRWTPFFSARPIIVPIDVV